MIRQPWGALAMCAVLIFGSLVLALGFPELAPTPLNPYLEKVFAWAVGASFVLWILPWIKNLAEVETGGN